MAPTPHRVILEAVDADGRNLVRECDCATGVDHHFDTGVVAVSAHLLRHFAYDHLPAHLQAISKPCAELAAAMVDTLLEPDTDTEDLDRALTKLVEAKDWFVRAALQRRT